MLAALAFVALKSARLDAVLDAPELSGAIVCASVVDLDGKVLYERNSKLRVLPASGFKSYTCAFALWKLGADWRPVTRIWKEASCTVVDSTGDPLLSRAQLQAVGKSLRLNNRLPVAVKQSYTPRIPPTWEWDDLPFRYGGRVTAFTIDRGGCELWAEDGKLNLRPQPRGIHVRWKPSAVPFAAKYDLSAGIVFATGQVPVGKVKLDAFAYPEPDREAALELGSRLESIDEVPKGEPDAVVSGSPLGQILTACLVPSDNNVAENLLLIGAQKDGPLSRLEPYPVATKRLTEFLERVVQIPADDVQVADGCGMSRQDTTTTRAMVRLYVWAAQQPTAAIWKNALPNPVRGTLLGRLAGVEFTGKTGTLTGVSSLTGYVKTKTGKQVVASVILNHFACPSKVAKGVEERFIREIVDSVQ